MDTTLVTLLTAVIKGILPVFAIFVGGILFTLGFVRGIEVLASPSEYSDSAFAYALPSATIVISLGLLHRGFQIFW